jgi:hypothetical protein
MFRARIGEAEERVASRAPQYWNDEANIPGLREVVQGLENVKAGASIKPGAHMYEVNVNADPEHFLDWDRRIGEQSARVRQATEADLQQQEFVAAAGKRLVDHVGDTLLGVKLQTELRRNGGNIRAALDTLATQGNDVWKARVAQARQLDWSDLTPATVYQGHLKGADVYHSLSQRVGGPEAASVELRQRGIPGLRYLDQGSRVTSATDLTRLEDQLTGAQQELAAWRRTAARARQRGSVSDSTERAVLAAQEQVVQLGERLRQARNPTRNIVMFPGTENLIDILRKYGILAPLAAGAAATRNRDDVGSPPPVRAPGRY